MSLLRADWKPFSGTMIADRPVAYRLRDGRELRGSQITKADHPNVIEQRWAGF